MLSSLLAATLVLQTPLPANSGTASSTATVSAADFFPLVTGTRRTYEEKAKDTSQNVDQVGPTVQIKGVDAIPIITQVNGQTVTTTFYRVDGDTVYLIANDMDHPLPKPLPILQVGDKPMQWDYSGLAGTDKWAEAISMKGSSRMLGEKMVLGKKVPVLEVKLVTTMGPSMAREIIEQTATYAKGIGLVELSSKTTVGKRSATNQLRLIKVEEAVARG